jgi:hypothetical protein
MSNIGDMHAHENQPGKADATQPQPQRPREIVTVTAVWSSTRFGFRVTAAGRVLYALSTASTASTAFHTSPSHRPLLTADAETYHSRSGVTASSTCRPEGLCHQSGKCPGFCRFHFDPAVSMPKNWSVRQRLSAFGAESATAHEGVRSPPPAHDAEDARRRVFVRGVRLKKSAQPGARYLANRFGPIHASRGSDDSCLAPDIAALCRPGHPLRRWFGGFSSFLT